MGNVPEQKTNATSTVAIAAETTYRGTVDHVARRRIQSEVVTEYRNRVASYVRRRLAPRHWQEAEQVGLIGLLVALEKFDASRGIAFWFFAVTYVRDELNAWMGHGVFWRPRSHDMKRDSKNPLRAVVSLHNELDTETVAADAPTVEDLVATAEGLSRLSEFVRTLSREDASLLVNGVGFGRGRANSSRAAGHKSLVERATAFVRGNEDAQASDRAGHRDSLR